MVGSSTKVWAKKKHKIITGPLLPNNLQTKFDTSSLIALNSTHFVIVGYHTDFDGDFRNSAIVSWPKLKSSKLPRFNGDVNFVNRCVVAIGFGKVQYTKSIFTACLTFFTSIDPMYSLKLLSYDIEKGMDEEWNVMASWSVNPADTVGKHFEKL